MGRVGGALAVVLLVGVPGALAAERGALAQPGSGPGLLARAEAAAAAGRVDEALLLARQAADERPTPERVLLRGELERQAADYHRDLGDIALAARRFDEAEQHYELAHLYSSVDPFLDEKLRRARDGIGQRAAVEGPLEGRRLYAERLGSIVLVRSSDRLGTGVVVEPGVVLTNAHVLSGETGTVVTSDGRAVAFSRSLKHPFADVAVIRVPELAAPPAPMGSGFALRPGERVSVIGSPQGLAFSFSDGAVSAVGRKLDGFTEMIQFTAPISQGSSGAPVFDTHGRVVALASLFFNEGQALNFGVPIEYAIELVRLADPL